MADHETEPDDLVERLEDSKGWPNCNTYSNLNLLGTLLSLTFERRKAMKPEPVTVTLEGNNTKSLGWIFGSRHPKDTTHRITFDLIDGEVDCSSIKMEKL